MKTETHDQGGYSNAREGWKKTGYGDTKTQQGNGQTRQTMFPDNQHDIDRGKSQKAGDFAYRLDQADMEAFQMHRLDCVVVEQNRIGLQSRHGSGSEDGEKSEHRLVDSSEHLDRKSTRLNS